MSNEMTSQVSAAGNGIRLLEGPGAAKAVSVQKPERPGAEQSGRAHETLEQNKKGREPAASELQETVREMNDFVQNVRRELNFTIDEEIGRTIIKVIDSEKEEVIRQIPAEEVVAFARNLKSLQENQDIKGVLLQTKV